MGLFEINNNNIGSFLGNIIVIEEEYQDFLVGLDFDNNENSKISTKIKNKWTQILDEWTKSDIMPNDVEYLIKNVFICFICL